MAVIVPYDVRHGPGVLTLIGGVFVEYGLTFEPGGYDADLTRIVSTYHEAGGGFWVLEHDDRVAGTVGVVPLSPAEAEIKRVYLEAPLRGQGWGRTLVEHAVRWAGTRGHRLVVLWSDVKFERSHLLYERLGFERVGIRDCHDVDQSREFRFEKWLPDPPPARR